MYPGSLFIAAVRKFDLDSQVHVWAHRGVGTNACVRMQGYQVNGQSSFSDLGAKGSDTSESTTAEA